MKMRFHSHGNEFDLHVNEISFSYERMSTKTRFGKEAKGNSEIAYYVGHYSMTWFMQRSLVVYRGISHLSLVFSRYTWCTLPKR